MLLLTVQCSLEELVMLEQDRNHLQVHAAHKQGTLRLRIEGHLCYGILVGNQVT